MIADVSEESANTGCSYAVVTDSPAHCGQDRSSQCQLELCLM